MCFCPEKLAKGLRRVIPARGGHWKSETHEPSHERDHDIKLLRFTEKRRLHLIKDWERPFEAGADEVTDFLVSSRRTSRLLFAELVTRKGQDGEAFVMSLPSLYRGKSLNFWRKKSFFFGVRTCFTLTLITSFIACSPKSCTTALQSPRSQSGRAGRRSQSV
jgi:hypothetical protein